MLDGTCGLLENSHLSQRASQGVAVKFHQVSDILASAMFAVCPQNCLLICKLQPTAGAGGSCLLEAPIGAPPHNYFCSKMQPRVQVQGAGNLFLVCC